jgi:hypothetical protein
MDPVTENQNILMQKPVKAFAYQDHQAHITVHMSAMQDPKIAQLIGQNPQAQALQAAMMAHINEHLGFQYRVEIENKLGFSMPATVDATGEDIHIDPEAEARLAPMLAQAAQRLLQQNQAQMAQQQAQQQAQDPIIQMQQQELQLKQQEQQRKAQKDAADIQLRNQQQQIEQMRIQSQEKVALKGQQLNALGEASRLMVDKQLDKEKFQQEAVKTLANNEFQHKQQSKQLYAEGLRNQLNAKLSRKDKE